jgi:hypothetical protein
MHLTGSVQAGLVRCFDFCKPQPGKPEKITSPVLSIVIRKLVTGIA